jgi:hypothetical protein
MGNMGTIMIDDGSIPKTEPLGEIKLIKLIVISWESYLKSETYPNPKPETHFYSDSLSRKTWDAN